MKKRLFASVVAGMIGLASVLPLTACGKDNGKIKVTIGMWPDSSQRADTAMFEEWEKAFEKDYPQYDIVGQRYEYSTETITSQVMTGQLPTVIQTYFTEPQKLIDRGWIADITKELNELGWLDKMDPDMRDAVSKNGKCYGVPRDGYGMGLFLNLDMLNYVEVIDKDADGNYVLYDDAGKPLYPTTFDEIREVSEKIVEAYQKGTYGLIVLSANNNGGWQFSNMAWNFGCEAMQVANGNGTYRANLNDPAAVKALEWIRDMRRDELIYPDASLTYNDWYAKIGSKTVAMAFCGSDALMLPTTTYNFPKDDIAFVPMPAVEGVEAKSLYGGTPFVFSAKASKEQIKGALLFLKYMGRSPETDEISVAAMERGHLTAEAKGIPILPTIKPWINSDYLEIANRLEERYVNVNTEYYKDFFDTIDTMKRPEEPYYCQDMYGELDNALQEVLSKSGTANCASLLNTANSQFYNNYLKNVKG